MSDLKIDAEPSSEQTTENSGGNGLVTIIFKWLGFLSLFLASLFFLKGVISTYILYSIYKIDSYALLGSIPIALVLSIIWYKYKHTKQHPVISATISFIVLLAVVLLSDYLGY